MTCKWLNLGQNPPRIPEFHTMTKVHEIIPVDNQSYLGALVQQSTFPFLLTHPYNRLKETTAYIKDTTHFINFNKNILLPEEAIWVLLTFVLSTLTFPKRRELISSANIMKSIIVKISHHNKILGDLKRLLPKENFFNDKDNTI